MTRALLLLSAIAATIVVPSISDGLAVELTVGGGAVAVVNGWFALRLIRLATRCRRGHEPGGRGRSIELLGVGLLSAAAVGATVAVRSALGLAPYDTAWLALAGLIVATLAFVPAMLHVAGAVRSAMARLRRAFDGLSTGICVLFMVWVLVISPHGAIGHVGFWVTLVTSCALAVAVLAALRAPKPRRGTVICAAGVALSVAGLAGLTLTMGDQAAVPFAVIAATLIAAPDVTWRGVRQPDGLTEPAPAEGDSGVATYPLLAVPAAAAIVVALHRLISGGDFDRPAIVLGIVGVATVALRETFASMDAFRYARRVALQEAQLRHLVAGSTDVIIVLDSELIVRWQSPAAARQFGLSDQEVVGRHFQSMLHPDDAVVVADRLAEFATERGASVDRDRPTLVEARLRDGFGRWRETESSVSDQRHVPAVNGLVVHIRDIGERKEMERALHRLAYADQLTGLANRRQMLMSIVALRSLPRARGSLLLLELDGFTAVSDVRGYDIGDAVLVEVARRMRAGSAETDLPARLSGDGFAVVTEAAPVHAYALATRLLTMLAEPVVLPGVTVHLTASIGMTDLAGGETCDDVLRRADLALRRAQQLGRGRIEWFDEAVEEALLRRMKLEMELPDALVRGELDVIYQPILDLAGPRPVAVEALLRWRHPRLGTLLPADIIPVAEDLGLITEIGSWVLYRAARQLGEWRRDGRDLSMAVNISPRQLAGPELPIDVAAALELNDLPPDRLVLEVAEGGLAVETGAAEDRVGQLRSLGVRTALDEFGAGVESLTHLRRLPIDLVKIGRSFFDEATEAAVPSIPIIDVIVGLGRRLGVDVVAQGLEVPGHLDVVRAAGCRLGQGHLFAHPQPAERTEAYLDGFRARSR